MNKLIIREYPCPYCEDEVEVSDNDCTVECKSCGSSLRVDRDAEQIDGRWKDLTTLTEI
jgi:transcription elongation factor Elf1